METREGFAGPVQVTIQVDAHERPAVVADITALVAGAAVNVLSPKVTSLCQFLDGGEAALRLIEAALGYQPDRGRNLAATQTASAQRPQPNGSRVTAAQATRRSRRSPHR